MKKVLSTVVIVAMLLSIVTIGAFANENLPEAKLEKLAPIVLTDADEYAVYDGSLHDGVGDKPLNVVVKFSAVDTEETVQNSPYKDWYTDFYITFDGLKNGSIVADGCYLAGIYGDFPWIVIPVDGLEVETGVSYPVVSMFDPHLTYEEICNGVKEMICAIYITPEIIADNPNMTVTLNLGIKNGEEGDVVIVNSSTYTANVLAGNLLEGMGTEESPYLIKNIADLEAFKASVNSGETKYNAEGVWVALDADIDLAGKNWTVGIGDGHNYSFDGCFDGKGHTIKNLTITPYADESGYVCGGLFGYIYGSVVIRDLVIENATIDCCSITRTGNKQTEPHNVGILAGFAYKCQNAVIEDVTVKGDVKIDAPNVDGVGGIVGYSYYKLGSIENCSIDANDGSYIKGYSFVGGITGYSYTDSLIENCTVKNIDIIGTSYSVGGIAGIVLSGNKISGCTVDSTVTVSGQANTGSVVGALGSDNVIIEDCAAEGKMVGGNYADNKAFVASVGNKYYTDIQAALNAAVTAGEDVTVEILTDIDLEGVDWIPVSVNGAVKPAAHLVTVNGNNHKITKLNNMLFSGTWAGKSGLIINDLTIADSNIVSDKDDTAGTVGVGAFIGYPQASETITLNNCHLINSTVEGGHWTGGLIGMAGGYNGDDGPVFMNLTITGCSVKDSVITGKGSVGGLMGHASCADWTKVVVENTVVSGNTVASTGSSNEKAGAVFGTVGAAGQETTADGETKVGGQFVAATVKNNTVTSNGTTITTIYGRQGTPTGKLELTGGSYDHKPISGEESWAGIKAGFALEENADGTYSVEREYTITLSTDGGKYSDGTSAIAFNAFFKQWESQAVDAFGMYIYKQGDELGAKVTVDRETAGTELVTAKGLFNAVVTAIPAEANNDYIVCLPYVMVGGNTITGEAKAVTASQFSKILAD